MIIILFYVIDLVCIFFFIGIWVISNCGIWIVISNIIENFKFCVDVVFDSLWIMECFFIDGMYYIFK